VVQAVGIKDMKEDLVKLVVVYQEKAGVLKKKQSIVKLWSDNDNVVKHYVSKAICVQANG
jgi:hypothetical protein